LLPLFSFLRLFFLSHYLPPPRGSPFLHPRPLYDEGFFSTFSSTRPLGLPSVRTFFSSSVLFFLSSFLSLGPFFFEISLPRLVCFRRGESPFLLGSVPGHLLFPPFFPSFFAPSSFLPVSLEYPLPSFLAARPSFPWFCARVLPSVADLFPNFSLAYLFVIDVLSLSGVRTLPALRHLLFVLLYPFPSLRLRRPSPATAQFFAGCPFLSISFPGVPAVALRILRIMFSARFFICLISSRYVRLPAGVFPPIRSFLFLLDFFCLLSRFLELSLSVSRLTRALSFRDRIFSSGTDFCRSFCMTWVFFLFASCASSVSLPRVFTPFP